MGHGSAPMAGSRSRSSGSGNAAIGSGNHSNNCNGHGQQCERREKQLPRKGTETRCQDAKSADPTPMENKPLESGKPGLTPMVTTGVEVSETVVEDFEGEKIPFSESPHSSLEVDGEDEDAGDEKEGKEEVDESPSIGCGWDSKTEAKLEELLMDRLKHLYFEALGKIRDLGYTASDACVALLKRGSCVGSRDALSNLVASATYHASTGSESPNQDLESAQRESLNGLLQALEEKHGSKMNRGDALWSLLVCDLDVTKAGQIDMSLSKENSASSKGEQAASIADVSPRIENAQKLKPLREEDSTSHAKSMKPLSSPNQKSLSSSNKEGYEKENQVRGKRSHTSIYDSFDSCLNPETSARSDESRAHSEFDSLILEKNAELHKCFLDQYLSHSSQMDSLDRSTQASPSNGVSMPTPPSKANSHLNANSMNANWKKGKEPNGNKKLNASETSHFNSLEQKDNTNTAIASSVTTAGSTPSCTNTVSRTTEQKKASDSTSPKGKPDNPTSTTDSSEHTDASQTSPEAKRTQSEDSSSGRENCTKSSNLGGKNVSMGNENSDKVRGVLHKFDQLSATHEEVLKQCVQLEARVEELEAQAGEKRGRRCAILQQKIKHLQAQVEERNQWAQQKVMQAAKKLLEDTKELKMLRAEKEEALRLKKEQQSMEDGFKSKLVEMESALRKASTQVDRANAAVRGLEVENAEIRAEMEAANLRLNEVLAKLTESAKKENKFQKKAQKWDQQKAKLQEELAEEKRKYASILQQLNLSKERLKQAEVRWRQEEKAKEEAVALADDERRTRETSELAAKRREDSLRRKSDSDNHRYREEIHRLEQQIAQLRISRPTSGHSFTHEGRNSKTNFPNDMDFQMLKSSNAQLLRQLAELQKSGHSRRERDVLRERECVMCMTEEMSVVFLPCAHQVVCMNCNELHEKQGMRDCPSCRTPIQQRIRVFGPL